MSRFNHPLQALLAAWLIALLNACGVAPPVDDHAALEFGAPDPNAPRLPPLPTRQFTVVTDGEEVVGELQALFTRDEDTLVDVARRFDLGYEELRQANPEVDVWLPGESTPVYLPTMSVLPAAPREGLVLNLPGMRLYYFVPEETVPADGPRSWSVKSHPIGIGREGWATPTGPATVASKARNPTWYPPASVRAEHAELGDPLPAVVPPGPENPLGAFALGLSKPGYLIHGTNKPPGVGMRVSHGCIRLFPEDIEALYERVAIGTPVHIVDQPVLAGWRAGQLYLEVHPPLSEDGRDLAVEAQRVIEAALQRAGRPGANIDEATVSWVLAERSGMPFPILEGGMSLHRYLASVRVIVNDLPIDGGEATAGL
jgi:L,D-transpeptidase ErfK/SrfK